MARYIIDDGRLTQRDSADFTHGSSTERRDKGDALTKADFDQIARTMGGYMLLRKIGYVAAKSAVQPELVITYRKGKETEAMAEPGDMIVSNLDPNRRPIVDELGRHDRYVIRRDKFPSLYESTAELLQVGDEPLRIYKAKSVVHAVFFARGFDICPPWGGRQTAPSGYLFYSPLTQEVYGCEKEVAESTFEPVR